MTKRYEKFEEWMIGKTALWDGEKGIVTRKHSDSDRHVWVEWENQDLGDAWIGVYYLVFLNVEVKDKSGQENKPIPWQVGQVVWDVRYGKGVVDTLAALKDYPVGVEFHDGKCASYTQDGKNRYEDKYRSLFFSEPKIEAELFPHKKPFVPKLKSGDMVLIKDKHGLFGEGTVRVVHKECDDRICISEAGDYFMKHDIASLHVIGGEVKWD